MRLLLVLALLLTATPAVAQATLESIRERALELNNRDRVKRGRRPLKRDAALDRAAQVHAEDMLKRRYFSHRGKDGRRARQRYLDVGGSRRVSHGENIAVCRNGCPPPDDARLKRLQRNWMRSRGHRVNILRREFTRFGYGLAYRKGSLYAVQTFSSEPPAHPSAGPPVNQVRRVVKPRRTTKRVVKRRKRSLWSVFRK